mgnify:CR=1 FL=1
MNGDDSMEARLQKWGNSDGIRIPSRLLKSLNLKTNDVVELIQKEDSIIISKPKKKHLTLEERFEMFDQLSDCEKGKLESYDWGEDVGKEKLD